MNEMLNEIGKIIELAPPVALAAAIYLLGIVLKKAPISSGWIPILLPFVGAAAYPFIAEVGKVSYDVAHPVALNVIYGFIIGCAPTCADQAWKHASAAFRKPEPPTESKP